MLSYFYSFKKSELALLIASSLLIAIWPMRNTIAARNILLVVCTLISIFYLYKNFRSLVWSQKQSIKHWVPIILVILFFIWVVIHYFYFSYDPVEQFKELKSTWVRSLMASTVGFALGLIINRREKGYGFIMLALISGLLILFYQYLVIVIRTGNLYESMLWNSIYWGKINEVLVGTLFIAGVLGFFTSNLRNKKQDTYQRTVFSLSAWSQAILYLLGVLVVLHCYVYELDTKNGIVITLAMTALFLIVSIRRYIFIPRFPFHKNIPYKLFLILFFILMLVVLSRQHFAINKGWTTIAEDVKISYQVDKYTNWMTIPATPIFTESGRKIPLNTYERTAWIVVATRTIIRYPLGYGLTNRAFRYLVKLDYPQSDLTVSHSGWLDLGLSFGIVGLFLAVGALFWTMVLSSSSKLIMASTVLWSAIGLFFAYAFLEIFFFHGVEILMFWLIFLPTMLLPTVDRNSR